MLLKAVGKKNSIWSCACGKQYDSALLVQKINSDSANLIAHNQAAAIAVKTISLLDGNIN